MPAVAATGVRVAAQGTEGAAAPVRSHSKWRRVVQARAQGALTM